MDSFPAYLLYFFIVFASIAVFAGYVYFFAVTAEFAPWSLGWLSGWSRCDLTFWEASVEPDLCPPPLIEETEFKGADKTIALVRQIPALPIAAVGFWLSCRRIDRITRLYS